jgi:O-antigen/teichoic acid export membrane protein
MADALLAGLPRIARITEEVRLRGVLALAVGAAAGAWWIIQWLLDEPVQSGRSWALALLTLVLTVVLGVINVPRRLREGLRNLRFPSARVVYETRADARDRRIRLCGAVFLSVIVILMFDQLAEWGGVTAAVIIGAAGGLGVTDLVEARRWARAEREREADLFVRVGPRALVAGFGRAEVYEVPLPPKNGNASR